MTDGVRKLLIALLVPLLLLLLAEGTARIVAADPAASTRLFSPVARGGRELWQRSPERDLPWNPSVAKEKPPGALRVACIGGSTVEGNPFPEVAFPRVLERRLAAALAPRPVEVMGCGVGGLYSDGELAVLREVLDFDPDLVVLYSGHNEFHPRNVAALLDAAAHPWRARLRAALEHTALGRASLRAAEGDRRPAPSVADQAPDHRPIDGPEYPLVVAHLASNVEQFCALCRQRRIPVVLCTAVSNLRDFPPMADVFAPGTSAPDRERVRDLLTRAEAATAAGEAVAALALLDQAQAIDATPASLEFQRGQALLAVGRADEARRCFVRARDTDGRTNRATTEVNDVMRAWSGRDGVQVVDVEADFASRAPAGIVGAESIVDNVHPTVAGQAAIADLLLQAMERAGLLDAGQLARARAATEPPANAPGEALGEAEQAARIGLNNLLLALEQGRSGRAGQEARDQLGRAHALDPGRVDVLVGLGLLSSLDGQPQAARDALTQALQREPAAVQAWAKAARGSPLVTSLFQRGGIRFEDDRAVAIP